MSSVTSLFSVVTLSASRGKNVSVWQFVILRKLFLMWLVLHPAFSVWIPFNCFFVSCYLFISPSLSFCLFLRTYMPKDKDVRINQGEKKRSKNDTISSRQIETSVQTDRRTVGLVDWCREKDDKSRPRRQLQMLFKSLWRQMNLRARVHTHTHFSQTHTLSHASFSTNNAYQQNCVT